MKTNEIIKLIEDNGWQIVRQKGSHIQFRHSIKPGTVTIPYHGNKDVPACLKTLF
jgi:predicted RNA binding protein YcfA (HicA-like mRNA interferase family)